MFGIDDLFLATFLEAAPEMFAAEGATALTAATEATAAAEAAAAAQATEAAAAQAASSGIMQAAPEVASLGAETTGLQGNAELMRSVANFRPETSMFGPESEQLASTAKTLGQQAPQIPTPNQIGNYPGGSSLPTGPNINQFPTPNEIGSYPGGSTPPTTLDANTFPTPNQAGFQPGGSTEPTVSNFRTASDIQTEGQSPLMRGLNAATDWAKENKLQAAGLGYMAASKMGLFDQKGNNAPITAYDGPLSKYKLSSDFKGSQANPEDYRYTPRQYASGGITSYAEGGVSHPDVGIYHDSDPDTMYLDPLTAAMVRQSKLDSRSYVNTKAKFKEPTRMGTLNFKPVAGSAQGGIMQAQRFDNGGVTGDGNLDLHIPLNVGNGGGGGDYSNFNGGGNGGGGGYDGFGGGFGGGNGIQQGGMNQPNPNFLSQQQQALPGVQALQKASRDYYNSDQFKNFKGGPNQAPPGFEALEKMQQDYLNGDEYKGFQNYAQEYQQSLGSRSAFGGGMNGGRGNLAQQLAQQQMEYSLANGGIAGLNQGGMYNLGGYAAGGNPRLLRGPGDGMSDNIPATINNRQPARLADGEFVVPADVVSHLGNGSTEAGAKKLHEMMDHVRKARTGNSEQGKEINPNKFMPK